MFRKKEIGKIDRMRISFDLDEVLFVSPNTHETEPALIFPFNKIYKERLRLGTPALIHRMQKEGFQVWVYTSSFRTEKYIRRLFLLYGIRFDGIINGYRHMNEVQKGRTHTLPNKMPNKYGIKLHIDDEDIMVKSGKMYGFKVYQLNEQDDEWAEKIMNYIYELERKEELKKGLNP